MHHLSLRRPVIRYTDNTVRHRRSQGCSGCTCTPQGGEKKFFRHNLQVKCVSAPQDTMYTPQPEQELFLGQFLLGGLDLEVYFDGL